MDADEARAWGEELEQRTRAHIRDATDIVTEVHAEGTYPRRVLDQRFVFAGSGVRFPVRVAITDPGYGLHNVAGRTLNVDVYAEPPGSAGAGEQHIAVGTISQTKQDITNGWHAILHPALQFVINPPKGE